MSTTDDEKTLLTLDHNGQIPIAIHSGTSTDVKLTVDLASLADPERLGGDHGHFQNGLKLVADGKKVPCTARYLKDSKQLEFRTGDLPSGCKQLVLTCFGQPIVTFNRDMETNQFIPDPAHRYDRLTVDELRMIADYDYGVHEVDKVLFDRTLLKGFDPKKHAPITDLHTHSSAQLSAKDLMDIAVKKHLDYPLELLGKLGITNLSESEHAAIKFGKGKGARFSPLEHEGLKCEQQNEPCDVIPLSALSPKHRHIVQDQLKVPQDKIICFSDFDKHYYRFVNPLVKNPAITKEMILQIAQDYKRNGIQYAELSTASMLNLNGADQAKWFEEMIEAVKEAEEQTRGPKGEPGVTLRFLASIPRNYSSDKVMAEMKKIKFAARHPLIAGIDLVGYEYNRTRHFSWMLEQIAEWARTSESTELDPRDKWDFKRDFTIRIHAGETRKNNGNVAEAVRIAQKYGIHVRVAHAVNEKTDKELDRVINELSSKHPPEVSIEFCPPSNIAYNNIQDLREVPFKRWLEHCKSWFLGSDGAGAIQTTPVQMAISALAAGVKLAELSYMHKTEERFIADQIKNVGLKTQAYQTLYEKKAANGKSADENFLAAFSNFVAKNNKLANQSVEKQKTPSAEFRSREVVNKELAALAAGKGIPPTPNLPDEFQGKMPILVAGASGDSIVGMEEARPAMKRAMHMLVAAIDPDKAYFVMGRSKSEGVTAALDEAIMEHNKQFPAKKFEVLALLTKDTPDLPHSLTWPVQQKGNIDSVPDNLINFMRAQYSSGKIPGVSIFIGGSNFTADMIRKCKDGHMDYLVMENAPGASKQFAEKLETSHRFSDGVTLLTRVSNYITAAGHAIFRHDDIMKESELAALEKAALARYPSRYTKKGMSHYAVDDIAPKQSFSSRS